MEKVAEAIKEILEGQRVWMEKIITEQRNWIQEQRTQADESTATSFATVSVPAFYNFDKTKHNWETYSAQLDQHFTAYGVTTEEHRRAYFLSWSGSELYELLQKLYGSENLNNKNYTELIKKLTEYFESKTHVLAARCEFFRSRMRSNQSYAEWVAELRGIARHCRFVCGEQQCKKEFVDELIRDVVVLHTPHDTVRTAALQNANPSLAHVLSLAEAFEATQKTIRTIANEVSVPEVNEVKVYGDNPRGRRKFKSANWNNKVMTESSRKGLKSCSGCGTHHDYRACSFREAKCYKCGKFGHIAPVCPTSDNIKLRITPRRRQIQNRAKVHTIQSIEQIYTVSEATGTPISDCYDRKYFISVQVNERVVKFQLDTGATCSIVGLTGYNQLGRPACSATKQELRAYGDVPVPILGVAQVRVIFDNQEKILPLLVTKSSKGGNIFGMNWFKAFNLGISRNTTDIDLISHLHAIDPEYEVTKLCERYRHLFDSTLGVCTSFKASLQLTSDAKPKFFKARILPFSQRELFKAEAERLVDAGIWKPIKFSQWAAPIVIAPKRDGGIRVCGDFKVTVNAQLAIDQYPIPRAEELFYKLQGGQLFSKIDLSDAYLQIELDEPAKEILVVNTPLGLYQYQRLPFGVASAPAIFQRLLEQVISGIEHCVNYLDDIIVTGRNDYEHLRNLEKVFKRLEENGLKCNRNKCKFMQREIVYLGHRISASGIRPSDAGIIAVRELPRPKDLKQLEAFIGKVNYYNKFIKNFSQLCTPLNGLRRKNTRFIWGKPQEAAFQELKRQIVQATTLVHFNDSYPIVLATDASAYGIGAVLSHIFPDGSERPIAHASKTLDVHQRKYSQLEKEALSIVFGVRKFHQYLYGRLFTLFTDHKPLAAIFNPNKELPVMTAHRLQRWALVLMAYRYRIKYRPTKQNANADALSRLPMGSDLEFDKEMCLELNLEAQENLTNFPVNAKMIEEHTNRDVCLRKVKQYVLQGWPDKLNKTEAHISPFFNRRLALSIENGILVLHSSSSRVVIPSSLQEKVLQLLHEGHWGVVRTKQLARKYCWWPQIDQNIEAKIASCNICQASSSAPKQVFSSWPEPQSAWERIHIDYAGPYLGDNWLICVDAYSKFPFVVRMKSTTATATIQALKGIFSLEGLPEAIVSDNGIQFTAQEFEQFCTMNGIQHITTAPFHPASNGEAERFVRTLKTSLVKILQETTNKDDALLACLHTYRISPNPKTGRSPAEILHGRQPRNLLSLLHSSNKNYSQPSSNSRCFRIGQSVYARNYSRGHKWIKAKVMSTIGQRMYQVAGRGFVWKRHQNQLKPSLDETAPLVNAPLQGNTASTQEENADRQLNQNSASSGANQPELPQGQPNSTSTGDNPPDLPDNRDHPPTPTAESASIPENNNNNVLPTSSRNLVGMKRDPGTNDTALRRSQRPRRPVLRFQPEGTF